MRLRKQWILLGVMVTLATCFGVFVLPFLLPPPAIQAVSASNAAGFNNRVAALAAAAISLAALLAMWRMRLTVRLPESVECAPMQRRFVLGWSLGLGFMVAVFSGTVYLSGLRYLNDYGYFIEQMSKAADFHRDLYTELEFPYGPLLFYPTIWIRSLFGLFSRPLDAAYIATLVLHQVFGLLLLAYAMQRLPIATRLRRWTFICFVVFSFTMALGLNYTFLRFITPVASLIFCLRGRRAAPAAVGVLFGELLNLGVSPEMGFAFATGAVAFGVLQAWERRAAGWLMVAVAPVLGSGAFLKLMGPAYLSMLQQFSSGAYNFIVEPQPHILLYLTALVWLAPVGLVSCWRSKREDRVLLLALFFSGLALLPVCFGRADAVHVVFNGLAILLLAMIPVSGWRLRNQQIWTAGVVVVVVIAQAIAVGMNRYTLQIIAENIALHVVPVSGRRALLRWRTPTHAIVAQQMAAEHPVFESSFDIERLRALTGGDKVVTLGDPTVAGETALRKAGMYVPDYFALMTGILGLPAERREVAVMNSAKWLLLPEGRFEPFTATPADTQPALGFLWPYRMRRQPFMCGRLMVESLSQNWRKVDAFDGLVLYKRR